MVPQTFFSLEGPNWTLMVGPPTFYCVVEMQNGTKCFPWFMNLSDYCWNIEPFDFHFDEKNVSYCSFNCVFIICNVTSN